MMTKIGRPREYTDDMAAMVLDMVSKNSYRRTAELCGVSLGMVQRIIAEAQQTGESVGMGQPVNEVQP